MLEFKERELKVKVYGQEVLLQYPRRKHWKVYREKLDGLTDIEKESVLVEFLEGLGLPNELSDELEMHHFESIVNELVGGKKK